MQEFFGINFPFAIIRLLRSLVNVFGLAWWARIETSDPDITYWFGPFLSRQELEVMLQSFCDNINLEQPETLRYSLLQTRRGEPLTILYED